QATKPRIPRAPLPSARGRLGHVAQGLQLLEGPCATGGQLRIAFLREPASAANEMGQTGLSRLDPALIDAVAITDQDALPLLNQGQKGVFGSVGVNERERDG